MRLTRSLPPHFLLPAWGTRQLLCVLQRAHKSTDAGHRPQNSSSSLGENEGSYNGTHNLRYHVTRKGRSSSAWHERTELPTGPSIDNQRAHQSTRGVKLQQTEPTNSLPKNEQVRKGSRSAAPEQTKTTSSLFDELFPEEKAAKQSEKKKTVEKLPAFEWHEGPKIDWRETVEKSAKERKNWFHRIPTSHDKKIETPPHRVVEEKRSTRELSVLVLSCASKTLEESDFFRLGSKGEHIEGWTSGIVKVIQGRDIYTLEPLGHYFLIFSNKVAAEAYLDQTIRLHTLSRVHGGGGSPIPPPLKYFRPGEDLKTLLQGFSLVPGHCRLSLRLVSQPHSPAVARVLSDGGAAAIARQKTKSEDMVLFSVDLAQINHHDLQLAISDDGRRRNLFWKLVDGDGAIVKINSDQPNRDDESKEESRFSRPAKRRNVRSPSRYILSFKDPHEARRFVREWHRRPFPVKKEHKVGDEPPPMINAEIFW